MSKLPKQFGKEIRFLLRGVYSEKRYLKVVERELNHQHDKGMSPNLNKSHTESASHVSWVVVVAIYGILKSDVPCMAHQILSN